MLVMKNVEIGNSRKQSQIRNDDRCLVIICLAEKLADDRERSIYGIKLIVVVCLIVLFLGSTFVEIYFKSEGTSDLNRKKRGYEERGDGNNYLEIEQIIQQKVAECKNDMNCCKQMESLYSKFTEVTQIDRIDEIEPFVCFDENQYISGQHRLGRKPPMQPNTQPFITNKFLKDKQTINQYYTPIVQNFQAPVNYYFWPQWQNVMPDNEEEEEESNSQSITNSPDENPFYLKSASYLNRSYKCSNSSGSGGSSNSKGCDGIRDCLDGKDEMQCSCRTRVDESRYCDGFFDCPDGDDEIGCFGCNNYSFSCDDWVLGMKRSGKLHGSCVLRHHRCDGIVNCFKTGKDEKECVLLASSVEEHNFDTVSMSIGYLHANYKGIWYPVCYGGQHTDWEMSAALEVCQNEIGMQTKPPVLNSMEPRINKYSGYYITSDYQTDRLELTNVCRSKNITFVICPTINCGSRMYKNPALQYRDIDDDIFELFDDNVRSKRESKNYERIVGGIASHPAAWPWVVTIYRNGLFHCGGVIVNELWIMSAAHCIEKYWLHYYEVQAGILRRFSFSPQEQNRIVVNIIEHQKYDRNSMHNDLALLKVNEPFQFNRWTRPICLPAPGVDPSPGTICTAVGWGATQERGLDPDHMRHVELPILDHCKHRIDMEGNELCAGYLEGGKDSCQGDSGGPLLCKVPLSPMQWYVAGVVSHGEGCARINEPGVYTRVSLYSSWIDNVINTKLRLNSTKPLWHCPGYYCDDNNRCISRRKRCDRIIDCLDGSDEFDCQDDHKLKLLQKHSAINHFDIIKKFPSKSSVVLFSDESTDSETSTSYVNGNTGSEATTDIFNVTTDFPAPTEQIALNFKDEDWKNDQDFFFCKIIEQLVPYSLKCDQNPDCEDGTDEMLCTCRDYLANTHKTALCDGIVDCKDLTDEFHPYCNKCTSEEFMCGIDQECIPLNKRCNHVSDCKSQEDEWNCFALNDGDQIHIDPDLKPVLRNSGILVHNVNGIWYPLCISENKSRDHSRLADDICSYLGFHGYEFFQHVKMIHWPIKEVGQSVPSAFNNYNSSKTKENCNVLQVLCSSQSYFINKELDDDFHINDFIDDTMQETYIYPWNVAVYIDGVYSCTASLIDTEWVLTHSSCFLNAPLTDNYISIISGMGKGHLNVEGPFEQIIRINAAIQEESSDIVMLKLSSKINITRYSKPIQLQKKHEFISDFQLCLAIGINKEETMTAVPLKIAQGVECDVAKLCFTRLNQKSDYCDVSTIDYPWKGTIACLTTEYGWVPTAVFNEPLGDCGFTNISMFTGVHFFTTAISNTLVKKNYFFDPPECNGWRCHLGQCLRWRHVCDNIRDCLRNEDESNEACLARNVSRDLKDISDCKTWEIRCKNGRCVPKYKFLNYENDCGDWTDEPEERTCSSYVRLTAPYLVCNGVRNCFDKTDESPNKCTCKSTHFLCNPKQYRTTLCVPMDFVCDGQSDCPNNADENQCYQLISKKAEPTNIGILYQRKMGVWYPLCLNSTDKIELSEMMKICKMVGYPSSKPKVAYFEDYIDVPIIDQFTRIKLNNVTQIIMRTSKDPISSKSQRILCTQFKLYCT